MKRVYACFTALLLAVSCFARAGEPLVAGGGADTPEAAYAAFQKAIRDGDNAKVLKCLTPEGQDTVVGGMVVRVCLPVLLAKDLGGRVRPEITGLLEKHGLDASKATKKAPFSVPASMVKDRVTFMNDVMKLYRDLNKTHWLSVLVDAELGNLRIEGDSATGEVSDLKGRVQDTTPIAFRKIDGKWLVHIGGAKPAPAPRPAVEGPALIGWPALRGGATRRGVVPGAEGPTEAAKVAWSQAGRKRERIDSSPAVVGNRIYTGSAVLSLFGGDSTGTGTIYCRDTDGGGVVWEYSGQGMDGGRLVSVFSSPAVAGEYKGEKNEDGSPRQGRYLVCGEGYHWDSNRRFYCLDLKPTRDGKRPTPALQWYQQTTSHVESSPCIHKCVDGISRVWVGAGDDGIWCAELESGKLAWMVGGTPSYYLAADCNAAAKLKAMAGKLVEIDATIKRVGVTITDPGQVLVTRIHGEPKEANEIPGVTKDAGKEFRRVIVGRVVLGKAPTVADEGVVGKRLVLEKATGISIRIPRYYADVESSPVAVNLPKDPRNREGKSRTLVYFGCGLAITHKNFGIDVSGLEKRKKRVPGKSGVACLDAVSGEEVWFREVPDPVFTPPTVVKGAKLKLENSGGRTTERIADLVIVGGGEGYLINTAAGPGRVLCLDAHTGEKIWEQKAGHTVLGAVAVEDGTAYACCMDGHLYAISIADGELVRKVRIGSPLVCSPAVTASAVYLVTRTGTACCIDRKSFAVRWRLPVLQASDMFASPVVAAGKMFIGTPGRGLAALVEDPDAATRRLRPWSGPGGGAARSGAVDGLGLPRVETGMAPRKWPAPVLPDRTVKGPLAACGQALYLPVKGPDDGVALARVRTVDGKTLWTGDCGGPVSALAATQESVFALAGRGATGQKLLRLNAESGTPKWRSDLGLLRGVLSLDGDRLVAADASGLTCLKAADAHPLWSRKVAGTPSGAPAGLGGLLIAAFEGDGNDFLLGLDRKSGEPAWKTALPGIPVGAVAAVDNFTAVACRDRREGKTGVLVLCSFTKDGCEPVWKKPLAGVPVGHAVLSKSFVAVATSDGRLYAFETASGKSLRADGFKVGQGLRAPAMAGDVLVYCGDGRLGAWDLAARTWPWRYRRQGLMGAPLSSPVVVDATVFITTAKRGLVAAGQPARESGPAK